MFAIACNNNNKEKRKRKRNRLTCVDEGSSEHSRRQSENLQPEKANANNQCSYSLNQSSIIYEDKRTVMVKPMWNEISYRSRAAKVDIISELRNLVWSSVSNIHPYHHITTATKICQFFFFLIKKLTRNLCSLYFYYYF